MSRIESMVAMNSQMKLGCALLMLAAFHTTPKLDAGVIVTVQEVGNDLVFSGEGSFKLDALTLLSSTGSGPTFAPKFADFVLAPSNISDARQYGGHSQISDPVGMGDGGFVPGFSSSQLTASGDIFGITAQRLIVPGDYQSGAQLSATNILHNQSLASIGLNSGTFVWSWGTGATADTLTYEVLESNAVPEPATFAVFGVWVLAAIPCARRRRSGSTK